jgi:hypothetical protein
MALEQYLIILNRRFNMIRSNCSPKLKLERSRLIGNALAKQICSWRERHLAPRGLYPLGRRHLRQRKQDSNEFVGIGA